MADRPHAITVTETAADAETKTLRIAFFDLVGSLTYPKKDADALLFALASTTRESVRAALLMSFLRCRTPLHVAFNLDMGGAS